MTITAAPRHANRSSSLCVDRRLPGRLNYERVRQLMLSLVPGDWPRASIALRLSRPFTRLFRIYKQPFDQHYVGTPELTWLSMDDRRGRSKGACIH
jgi:hypothetical protein